MKLRYLAVVALAAVSTLAQAQSKPEDLIHLRQGGFQLLARNVGALNSIAKGDVPFNKETATNTAEFVSLLVPQIWAGFGAGSDKGAPTRANAKIWSDDAGFKAAQEKLLVITRKLPAAAGDANSLKAALADIGGACKNCHDNYRDSSYH
ncbi:cytochrome c [Uliginosibacterium sp. H3]|uniref:Cytochrome c n=1 Tax=Uliginosibacterium silvisoli TaxID=3114758 RepID=A0ABU6K5E8_9RHOO|nr:cytochrome c [Uliginosibacterium sp. H3]